MQYLVQVSNLTGDSSGKNETLSAVVQVASLALTAVAVALAPMGPVVAFPLGMVYGLGSALLFILSPKEMTPPSPPHLEDIDKTISRGVGDPLDLADAQHAAK